MFKFQNLYLPEWQWTDCTNALNEGKENKEINNSKKNRIYKYNILKVYICI